MTIMADILKREWMEPRKAGANLPIKPSIFKWSVKKLRDDTPPLATSEKQPMIECNYQSNHMILNYGDNIEEKHLDA